MSDFYPIDLSDEEKAAGFVLTEIENPSARRGQPRKVEAVVRSLDEEQRLVKMRDVDSVNYEHQAYISAAPKRKWVPVGTPAVTLAQAAARRPLSAEDLKDATGWQSAIWKKFS